MTEIPAGPVKDFIGATNRHDADALLAVFAADASVTDDGTTYTGSAEIEQWIREHQIAPRITLGPTAYENGDGSAVQLTASADGDFPGGPLPFAFRFTLDAQSVQALEIRIAE
ncbi:nuclear transport factor 2 family protein [Curtobacterium sp. MCBD17_032]|uniref:nuclear transport factor 2 family protein n=1 Tax=Curtobacterium sp. MCBD17_032 TaxID=2175659 RepID=UPI000DA8699C|nr:nuclear transport factor 2 family protein [Curtobacterium sp. MCBD17_032]PZE86783.1 nuclear transport factor 2 family protein [Curtobacterium sp. MCBD17_032]